MSNARTLPQLLVLGAMALCTVGALTGAKAGQDKNGGVRIAVFDKDRIVMENKNLVDINMKMAKKREEAAFTTQVWQQNYLLPEDKQKRLADLMFEEKSTPPPATIEKAKKDEIAKLQGEAKTLFDEFNRLQAKGGNALSQEEKDRLQILSRAFNDTQSRITTRIRAHDEEVQKVLQEAERKAVKDTREGVAKIAKEKGVAVVFSNEFVWYADVDITDAIVGYVNKQK